MKQTQKCECGEHAYHVRESMPLCHGCVLEYDIVLAEPVQEDDALFTDEEWEEFLFLAGQPNAISDMPTTVRDQEAADRELLGVDGPEDTYPE